MFLRNLENCSTLKTIWFLSINFSIIIEPAGVIFDPAMTPRGRGQKPRRGRGLQFWTGPWTPRGRGQNIFPGPWPRRGRGHKKGPGFWPRLLRGHETGPRFLPRLIRGLKTGPGFWPRLLRGHETWPGPGSKRGLTPWPRFDPVCYKNSGAGPGIRVKLQ